MFRHKNSTPVAAEQPALTKEKNTEKTVAPIVAEPITMDGLKDLLEKNLKWSQIIYEQNRKINNKLLWSAIASWIKTFLILAPIILAVWFLPPYIKNIWEQYGSLLGVKSSPTTVTNTQSLEQIIKLLPINSAEREQLKAILK